MGVEKANRSMGLVGREVIERFPEHELTIRRLARQSEAFREMCRDYSAGIEALTRWEHAKDSQLDPRIVEIRQSLAEIEDEIRAALSEATPSSLAGRSR